MAKTFETRIKYTFHVSFTTQADTERDFSSIEAQKLDDLDGEIGKMLETLAVENGINISFGDAEHE